MAKEVGIKLNVNAAGAVDGANKTQKAMLDLKRTAKDLTKEGADVGVALQQIAEKGGPAFQKLISEMQAAGASTAELKKAVTDLANAQIGAARQQKQAIMDMAKAQKAAAEDANQAFDKLKSGAKELGIGLAAAGATFAVAMKPAVDFEKRLSDIGKTAEASTDQMRDLGKYLLSISASTGQGPEKLAEGIEKLVAAGLGLKESAASIETIARVATATGASIEDVSATAFQLQNALKIKPEELTQAFDALALAGKAGAFELRDMAVAMPTVASAAAALGVSGLEGANSIAAMMQMVRKDAPDSAIAATRLTDAMMKMAAPETVKNFKKFGVDIEAVLKDAREKGINPFEAAINELQELTGGDIFRLGEIIGDKEAKMALSSLMKYRDEFAALKQDLATSSAGAIDKDFERSMATAHVQLQVFADAVTTLAVTFGNTFLPTLTEGVKALTEFTKTFADLSPDTVRALSQVVLFTAGGVALSKAIGVSILAVRAFQASMAAAGAASMAGSAGMLAARAALGPLALVAVALEVGLVAATVATEKHTAALEKQIKRVEDANAVMREHRQVLADLANGNLDSAKADIQGAKAAVAAKEARLAALKDERTAAKTAFDEAVAEQNLLRARAGKTEDSANLTAAREKLRTANQMVAVEQRQLGVLQKNLGVADSQVKAEDKKGAAKQKTTESSAKEVKEQLRMALTAMDVEALQEDWTHQQKIAHLQEIRTIKGLTAEQILGIDEKIAQEQKRLRDDAAKDATKAANDALNRDVKTLDRGVKSGAITPEQQEQGLRNILRTHKLTAEQREKIEDQLTDATKRNVDERMDAELRAQLRLEKQGKASPEDRAKLLERQAGNGSLTPKEAESKRDDAADIRLQQRQEEAEAASSILDSAIKEKEIREQTLRDEQAGGKNVSAELQANLQEQLTLRLRVIETAAAKELESAHHTELQKRALMQRTHVAQLDALRATRAALKQMLDDQSTGGAKRVDDVLSRIQQLADKKKDEGAGTDDNDPFREVNKKHAADNEKADADAARRVAGAVQGGRAADSSDLDRFGLRRTTDPALGGQNTGATNSKGEAVAYVTDADLKKKFGGPADVNAQQQTVAAISALDVQIAALGTGLDGSMGNLSTSIGTLSSSIDRLTGADGGKGGAAAPPATAPANAPGSAGAAPSSDIFNRPGAVGSPGGPTSAPGGPGRGYVPPEIKSGTTGTPGGPTSAPGGPGRGYDHEAAIRMNIPVPNIPSGVTPPAPPSAKLVAGTFTPPLSVLPGSANAGASGGAGADLNGAAADLKGAAAALKAAAAPSKIEVGMNVKIEGGPKSVTPATEAKGRAYAEGLATDLTGDGLRTVA